MRPRTVQRKLISAASLLLYVAAVLGLPIADASVAVSQGPAVVHIEDDREERHSHGHDHQDCLVCRTIERSSSDVGDPSFATSSAVRATAPYHRDLAPPPPGARVSALGPRAPPLA